MTVWVAGMEQSPALAVSARGSSRLSNPPPPLFRTLRNLGRDEPVRGLDLRPTVDAEFLDQ